MRYLVNAILSEILQRAEQNDTVRFVLPSFPAPVLVTVGQRLEEGLARMTSRRSSLIYGVAKGLVDEWERSGSPEEKSCAERIKQKGWYNETDNLTSIRNRQRNPSEEDLLVAVIAGYDHVEDRGSLKEFFHLGDQQIWEIHLHRSFGAWVKEKLEDANLESSGDGAIRMAELLQGLRAYGLADLAAISRYLEGLDLSAASSQWEAYRILLGNLDAFGMPSMTSLASSSSKMPAQYIPRAVEFLSYGMFLDESRRRKATRKIDEYRNASKKRLPREGELGVFSTVEDLLDTLERYVEKGADQERRQLMTADFPFILDGILEHRHHRSDGDNLTPKESVRKLSGLPPEVFLRAIWLTLGDYLKKVADRNLTPEESLRRIELRATGYQNDMEGEEGETADGFLLRALGGIDELLEKQVELRLPGRSDPLEISSSLCPSRAKDMKTTVKAGAEPYLAFDVSIVDEDIEEGSFRKSFRWQLPQNHPTRLLDQMFRWAYEWYRDESKGNAIPAYSAPLVSELFLARNEEEVYRLISKAVGNPDRMVIALTPIGLSDDAASMGLETLSIAYQQFIESCVDEEKGFFAALANQFEQVSQRYQDCCRYYLQAVESTANGLVQLGGPLFKAFCLFDSKGVGRPGWKWDKQADHFVATPLHPAVLDMLRFQHAFLLEIFSVMATENLVGRQLVRAFAESRWNRAVDLARLDRPLAATLRDQSTLDSTVRGFGYFHLVGDHRSGWVSDSTEARLLLEHESEDEDEVDEGTLFQETAESQLVRRILRDYRSVHPHAQEGLTIGAYCGRDLQPIIAGVDGFLNDTLSSQEDGQYSLKLVVFSESGDSSLALRWIRGWQERSQALDGASSKGYYSRCHLSIFHRVLPPEDDGKWSALAALLEKTHLDLLFFTDFVPAISTEFETITAEEPSAEGFRKFPVLDKAGCILQGAAHELTRSRVLSNPRFRLAAMHTEVMARLVKGALPAEMRHLVTSKSSFEPCVKAVNAGHKGSSWVICIDPAVDERIIRGSVPHGGSAREIIGFGSGIGVHGESNFTVSTDKFLMADVKRRVAQHLASIVKEWDEKTTKDVADRLIGETQGMAGLSLVKAAGRSQYVRDYLAFAVTKKLLERNPEALCDELVSLDAFVHWFDDGNSQIRPDLMRLQAHISPEGFFQIGVQVIECKLAERSESLLEEAANQVEAGLKRLSACMRPRESAKPEGVGGVGDRPDQRYWWMQLHRLIATRTEVPMKSFQKTTAALERLSEGYFDIQWQGAVLAFWADQSGLRVNESRPRIVKLRGREIRVPVVEMGPDVVLRLCREEQRFDPFKSAGVAHFHFVRRQESREDGRETAEREDLGGGDRAAHGPETAILGVGRDEGAEESGLDSQQEGGEARERRVPARILLGSTKNGRAVYWEFGHPKLPNRHILVFGASGTGKTYTIQAILMELGKAGQNALIVDYTNGFTGKQMEREIVSRLQPQQYIVRKKPLPLNPFRRQTDYIDDDPLEENPANTAQRVCGVFAEVYQLGDQQKSALYSAIRDGVAEEGESFDLEALLRRLEVLRASGEGSASAASSVVSKIRPFVDMKPFGPEDADGWERLFLDRNARCHVIQLAGFSRDASRLITEFTLIDLYRYYRARGTVDNPRVIVLDEVQNLDHSLDSPLGQLLTEGRKFGISLILATQTLSNLEKDERDRLFQASHKLFFKPADTELKSFAQILANATGEQVDDWISRLSSLEKGECFSIGPALNESTGDLDMKKHFRIRIKPLTER